jgi:phosphoserine phosphatase
MQPFTAHVTVTGLDRPGVTSALFAALAAHDVEVIEVAQLVLRGRLVLGVVLAVHGDPSALSRAATHAAEALGTEVEVMTSEEPPQAAVRRAQRHHVLVLGRPLRAGAVSEVARRIADLGGNIDSINRLVARPVTALELIVSGADHIRLGSTLVAAAKETGTDIAVERAALQRRAKRLLLLDLDSTLICQDSWSHLARVGGRSGESARLLSSAATDPATRDRAELIRARAGLLTGLPATALDEARERMQCAPGAAALVGLLRRMGYRVGVVTGGVAQVAERMVDGLPLDFLAGNRLEVADGRCTGRIVGDVVDRLGRARALVRFAEAYGVPMSQTVAVGAGDTNVDMLTLAGLGVTFRAGAPGAAAGSALDDLPPEGSDDPIAEFDPLLFVLGLSRDDLIELPAAALAGRGEVAPLAAG